MKNNGQVEIVWAECPPKRCFKWKEFSEELKKNPERWAEITIEKRNVLGTSQVLRSYGLEVAVRNYKIYARYVPKDT